MTFGGLSESWREVESIILPAEGKTLWVGEKIVLLLEARSYHGKYWEKRNGRFSLLRNTHCTQYQTVVESIEFARLLSEKTIHRVTSRSELAKWALLVEGLDTEVNLRQSYFTIDHEMKSVIDEQIGEVATIQFDQLWESQKIEKLGFEDVEYSEANYYDYLSEHIGYIFEAMTYMFSGTYNQIKGLHLFEEGADLQEGLEVLKRLVFGSH